MRLDTRFWRSHALLPAALFLLIASLLAFTDLDRQLAHAWAFDALQNRFIGQKVFWADEILHRGGRYAIWAVGLICILRWLISAGTYRRAWGFAFCALALSTSLVAGLKQITNVDCPVDLQGFGGVRPYIHLFANRPDGLPHARCFPGAHSASGFALVALYFAFRDVNRRRARAALLAGIFVGGLFSLAQQARGAHFLSHDLWSAFIVWFTCLGLYRFGSSILKTSTARPMTAPSATSISSVHSAACRLPPMAAANNECSIRSSG